MELKEAIQQRHSVRNFSDKKVSLDLIYEMIKLANLAPSAGNLQAREFIIVDDFEIKKRMSLAALDQNFIVEAPVNIVVCTHLGRISSYGRRGRELYCIQGSAAAVEHILLLAVDNGLGTCWVGDFYEDKVKEILNIPKDIRVVELMPLGYPASSPKPKRRLSLSEIVRYDTW